MYISNKPSKYGIKILIMYDNGTKYMINGMSYLLRGTRTNGVPLGEYYLKELSEPVHSICCNITCDNRDVNNF